MDPTQINLPFSEENELEQIFEEPNQEDELDMPTKDMPSPYSKDAPKFNCDKPSELNRYIKRLEELFTKHSIEDDADKIKYLGAYADARTEKEWEAMSSYDGTFAEHKKEIISSYPEASNEARGSIKELRRIRDEYSGITCQDLTRLQAYKRAFVAEAKKLQAEPALLSNHEAIEIFLKPLTDGFRKKIIDKLDLVETVTPTAGHENRRPEDRFPLAKIIEIAVNVASGMQGTYGTTDSSSSRKDNDRREMRSYIKTEQDDIGNTLAQMQDQQKISEKHLLSALEVMTKSIQQAVQSQNNQQAQPVYQAPAPMYQNQGYQPQMQAVRPRALFNPNASTSSSACFYCSEEGHMKDECPHRAAHIVKGWIMLDHRNRPTLPDGRFIPLAGGSNPKMRVETLNGVPRPDKPVASNVQSLVGRPGVIQLAQSVGSYTVPTTQSEIEDALEKFDLNDLAQYISTRSGQGVPIDSNEEGFSKVQ